jgi:D-sedoheptulose 7-phosphate isomerase
MNNAEHILETFHQHLDCTMQSMEALAPAIAEAADLMTQSLLGEGKILCCGEGIAGLLAQHFSASLLNRFQRERPGLPALALCSDAATLTAIASDNSFNEIFARQVRALAMPQDMLLLINPGSGSGIALQTLQAAHDRGLQVIVIGPEEDSDLQALLLPEDLELRIAGSRRGRFAEVALIALNCLCETIEQQLFGAEV